MAKSQKPKAAKKPKSLKLKRSFSLKGLGRIEAGTDLTDEIREAWKQTSPLNIEDYAE